MSFANIYTHRKVAETAAKGCDVCYRATSSVLVASENKDFFYVCPSHLKDRNFCSPIIDKEAVEAKKKKELEEEIERVKKEYEEKQKKKKEKEEKDKNTDKDKEKEKEQSKDDEKNDDEKKEDGGKSPEKVSKRASATSSTLKTTTDELLGRHRDTHSAHGGAPRFRAPQVRNPPTTNAKIYRYQAQLLDRNFYGIRLEKKRQMEIAKRNRERLQQPNLFPSVPKGAPGAPGN
ncbi:DUF1742-domain-containing protein [Colletotrichum caudatum]|nr:DUF1742-domain-containing protein [Colletotrichum caudatum]